MTTSRVLAALVCAAAVGCGGGGLSAPKTAPVSGTVQFKGKPIAGVKVTFHPKFDIGGDAKFTPSGETNGDGKFSLSTAAANDGAPPGEYAVTFALPRADSDARGLDVEVDQWKGKYSDPATSAFKVTIQKGDNALETFKLD